MAIDLTCPTCGEFFGKTTECYRDFSCGNCGEEIHNEDGYEDEDEDED